MKKLISIFLVILMIIASIPYSVSAVSDTVEDNEIIYLSEGCYITIELSQIISRTSTTVSNTKTYIARSSNGEEIWRAVLSGTFTYNGSTATCNSSSCDITISNDAWYVASKTVGKSGASATAELTMGKKFLGITTNKETIELTLTCSPTGSFS